MRITQIVLVAAAMLWTTLGLPTAAWADQTTKASAKPSVEKGAQYDKVLDSEGLFRHRHARLMRLHHLAMEHGRLARAGEIEQLMEHLQEDHVKSLHERRAQMKELHKAHVDELLSEHRARSKHIKTELKSHEETVERHREVREHDAERRAEALELHAERLQEQRKARAQQRDEAAKDHREAGKRRATQHHEVADDQHRSHQHRAKKRESVAKRHHDGPHSGIDGRRDGARPDNDQRRHHRIIKPRRDGVDRRSDTRVGKNRTARGARLPSHHEAKEQAQRTIKPEDADRVFEKLRREIERKPGRRGSR